MRQNELITEKKGKCKNDIEDIILALSFLQRVREGEGGRDGGREGEMEGGGRDGGGGREGEREGDP